jgi:hypothetical protein
MSNFEFEAIGGQKNYFLQDAEDIRKWLYRWIQRASEALQQIVQTRNIETLERYVT